MFLAFDPDAVAVLVVTRVNEGMSVGVAGRDLAKPDFLRVLERYIEASREAAAHD